MDGLSLPSDTFLLYFGLRREFCMILSVQQVFKIILKQQRLYDGLFIETQRKSEHRRRQEKIHMCISCSQRRHTHTLQTSELVVRATHIERQFLCPVVHNGPPSRSAPQCWAESLKERLSTAVFVRGREGVPACGLPCLGLPLLPARPFSSARHSGNSRTEPEANLSRHAPPAK